jgi:hypothetical protein
MAGANIFAIYANAAGTNVTLSPRTGSGHIQPSASTAAMVTLLDGSMVTKDMMIANVKCKLEIRYYISAADSPRLQLPKLEWRHNGLHF